MTSIAFIDPDPSPLARIRLESEIVSGEGQRTVIMPGDTVRMSVWIDDIRDNPLGIFASFVDVSFVDTDRGAVPVSLVPESVAIGPEYKHLLTTESDENSLLVGGVTDAGASSFPTSALLARFDLIGIHPGEVSLNANVPVDNLDYEFLLVGHDEAVTNEEIVFENNIFDIIGHNAENPLDVNADGDIDHVDVLHTINFLNKRSLGTLSINPSRGLVDTNDDGVITPRDALRIVNYLIRSQSTNDAAESGSQKTSFENIDDDEISSLRLQFGGRPDLVGQALGQQSDGRFIVGAISTSRENGAPEHVLGRFDAQGNQDLTFGEEGLVNVNIDRLRGLDVLADDRIVVASYDAVQDETVVRFSIFSPDGDALERTTDVSDVNLTYFESTNDGAIWFASRSVHGSSTTVFHILADGQLNGNVEPQRWDGEPAWILPLPDNSVLIGSVTHSNNSLSSTIVKLNELGQLDESFGENGIGTYPFALGQRARWVDDAQSLFAEASVGGVRGVVKLNHQGERDVAFGVDGMIPIPPRLRWVFHIRDDGKPVTLTTTYTNGESAGLLEQFLPNGAPDPSFGSEGKHVFDTMYFEDSEEDLAIEEDVISRSVSNEGELIGLSTPITNSHIQPFYLFRLKN